MKVQAPPWQLTAAANNGKRHRRHSSATRRWPARPRTLTAGGKGAPSMVTFSLRAIVHFGCEGIREQQGQHCRPHDQNRTTDSAHARQGLDTRARSVYSSATQFGNSHSAPQAAVRPLCRWWHQTAVRVPRRCLCLSVRHCSHPGAYTLDVCMHQSTPNSAYHSSATRASARMVKRSSSGSRSMKLLITRIESCTAPHVRTCDCSTRAAAARASHDAPPAACRARWAHG